MGLCKRDPITGSPLCQSGGATFGAFAITAIIAAGLYAIVGCKWNGCPLPDRCNRETRLCEHIPCSETHGCPAGYDCALDKHICR
jgi:hypothetical protein